MDDSSPGQAGVAPAGGRGATLAGLAFFAGLTLVVGVAAARATGGHLTYAQDDAYIHMALARNVAEHGVWGVYAGRFASASSSPLWTLLLSLAFRILGVRDSLPLLLNLVFASASVILFGSVLRDQRVPARLSLLMLVTFVAAVPLVVLVWVGMETTLQVWLTLLVVWKCQTACEARPDDRRSRVELCLLAALLVATRYEGAFVLVGCAALLVRRRKPWLAGAVLAAGALPVTAVGVWNWSHGWFFLPASVLMKRTLFVRLDPATFAHDLAESLGTLRLPPTLVVLTLAVAAGHLALAIGRESGRQSRGVFTVFTVTALLHLIAGRFSVFYRYEAYLYALALLAMVPVVVSVARHLNERRPWPALPASLGLGAVAAAGGALLIQALAANVQAPLASRNIFEQQRQMARFIAEYYDRDLVALNDIGAVSYYSHADVLDLEGLASLEIARLHVSGRAPRPFPQLIAQSRPAEIAVVFERWHGADPQDVDGWQRIATWTITRNVVCGDATVSFFARRSRAEELRRHLRDYAPTLPASVAVHDDAGF